MDVDLKGRVGRCTCGHQPQCHVLRRCAPGAMCHLATVRVCARTYPPSPTAPDIAAKRSDVTVGEPDSGVTETVAGATPPNFLVDAHVVTVQPAEESADWTDEGAAARRWNAAGVITKISDKHGSIFQVRFDDGRYAWYEPRELRLAKPPHETYPERCILCGLGFWCVEEVTYRADGSPIHVGHAWADLEQARHRDSHAVEQPPLRDQEGAEQRREILGTCVNCRKTGCDSSHVCQPAGDEQYASLRRVLDLAYEQAAVGKGAQRHGMPGVSFDEQPTMRICEWLDSNHFALGQAIKKLRESARLPKEQALADILGAVVYGCHSYLVRERLP